MFKLVLIPGLCAIAASAQSPVPSPAPLSPDVVVQKQAFNLTLGPIGITSALSGPMSTIAGAPYSAQAVTQRIQMLADGNRITQTTSNNVARDGKGRVYREESVPGQGNSNGETPHLVLIEDPVAGVHITLDSSSKTAMKMASGQMKRADEAAARNGVPPIVTSDRFLFSSAGSGPDIQIVTAKMIKDTDEAKQVKTGLGTQTIEGVTATGTRIARTIEAGEMGNDLPIVITTETWYSPDLKLLVMSKSTDPRMGETTYKLTNILRAEPDPTLFQIPSDYTVKEGPGDVVFFKKLDK